MIVLVGRVLDAGVSNVGTVSVTNVDLPVILAQSNSVLSFLSLISAWEDTQCASLIWQFYIKKQSNNVTFFLIIVTKKKTKIKLTLSRKIQMSKIFNYPLKIRLMISNLVEIK